MALSDAIREYVRDDSSVGLGGQNIGRCAMAAIHEIIRQGQRNLTLYGCNLSISMDMLVGAGLVARCESGSGNLERFGTTFCWRRKVESGELEVEDFSHLAMVSRFLAGEMGVPFMPTKSLLGTDILAYNSGGGRKKFEIVDNPWNPGEPVVLLPAVNPDVSIIHVQRADPMGNLFIEGFSTHEPEMIRASKSVIVTCEELVSPEEARRHPEHTTIPFLYVSAVVHQPWGAHPTSVHRYYDYDGDHIRAYQDCAKQGGQALAGYLDRYVYGCRSFTEYLDWIGGPPRLEALRASMLAMTGSS
jgi:acyl CoA:acetate/3-ketoacid CoA transferase alpha subunit